MAKRQTSHPRLWCHDGGIYLPYQRKVRFIEALINITTTKQTKFTEIVPTFHLKLLNIVKKKYSAIFYSVLLKNTNHKM